MTQIFYILLLILVVTVFALTWIALGWNLMEVINGR
jgi:hypothetical protein